MGSLSRKLANKIDVHSHYVPEQYRQDCIQHGHSRPDGTLGVPKWSEESHLQMMDALNVSKAYLSVTSPGTHLVQGDDKLARRITRECNEAAAGFKKRCPDRIGFFASTTLPDVAGTLEEIEFALDKNGLNADGVVVETNHHGTYLGDSAFDKVMQELDRRKAVVFIHPTTPCLPTGQKALTLPAYPAPLLEFFFETARAVANLFLSGTVTTYPNVTYILSHCGGALPPMIRRICRASPILGLGDELTPEKFKTILNRQFYFDTSGWPLPEQIHGLLQYITPERIMYGTDYPWTPIEFVTENSNDYDEHVPKVFPRQEDQAAICYGNAQRLFGS